MRVEIPLRSAVSRLLLGALILATVFYWTREAENVAFADWISKIPLFGTELAAKAQPDDPQYEYQLGNYWMIAAQQPQTALPHYLRATQLDPLNGHYWGQSALAFQQVGDAVRANEAVTRSLTVDPTTPELLWEAANVYSFLGDSEKSLDAIRKFVIAMPDQTPIAAQLGWRTTRNAELLLDAALPKGMKSDLSLLIALVRAEDPAASARIQVLDTDPNNDFVHNLATMAVPQPNQDTKGVAAGINLVAEREKARAEMLQLISRRTGRDWAKTESELAAQHATSLDNAYRESQNEKQRKAVDSADVFGGAAVAWKHLLSESERFDHRLALPYMQMLIDADMSAEAQEAWRMLVLREPRLKQWTVGANLVHNPSFEFELLNGGFDWQYSSSPNLDLGLDHRKGKDGDSSLFMRFKNKQVSDAGVVQYVPVKPSTRYEFSGYLKADSLQGATGIRFQVQDVDATEPYFESNDVKGTTGWVRVVGTFVTRDSSRFVTIRVTRNPGDTLIKGSAWADAVTLVEVGAR